MVDDVMAEFKNRRFVVAPAELLENPSEHVVILSDFEYWNNHYDELKTWVEQNNGFIQGMGLILPDAQTLTTFCLRWS